MTTLAEYAERQRVLKARALAADIQSRIALEHTERGRAAQEMWTLYRRWKKRALGLQAKLDTTEERNQQLTKRVSEWTRKTTKATLMVTPAEYARWQAWAESQGVSLSEAIRYAMEHAMARSRKA